jgi:uncharacterized phage protein (TIGR02216 family)
MKDPEQFDWDFLMRFGLGVLGLAPRDFWRMTPREFEAAIKGRTGQIDTSPGIGRSEMLRLSLQFPDGGTIR